jgi:hypothetical protein
VVERFLRIKKPGAVDTTTLTAELEIRMRADAHRKYFETSQGRERLQNFFKKALQNDVSLTIPVLHSLALMLALMLALTLACILS